MRKIIAILMLNVYLVNLVGGSILMDYYIMRNSAASVSRIDKGDYSRERLVELKVPVRLSYYSSSLKYERFYGEIELEGQYYHYVMRRVFNDTVFLLCLPDDTRTKLCKARTAFGLLAVDMGNSSSSSKSGNNTPKKLAPSSDYCQLDLSFELFTYDTVNKIGKNFIFTRLNSCFIEPPVKPPCVVNG